jgi:hypothetical protein
VEDVDAISKATEDAEEISVPDQEEDGNREESPVEASETRQACRTDTGVAQANRALP